MIRSPELVRCPVCGSKKINSFKARGTAEMLCFCRGEGTVMESLDDREVTLADPDEDRYGLGQTSSESINTESQAISAQTGNIYDDSNDIDADNAVDVTAPKPRGIKSILSRFLSS